MAHYATWFEISDPIGKHSGPQLLLAVKELVEVELRASGGGREDWEKEDGAIEEAAYAEISAERNLSSTDEQLIRLEVRLCARREKLHAEIRSRFLMMSTDEPPKLRSGPPRLLQTLAEQFRCTIGSDEVSYKPFSVTEGNGEQYVRNSLASAERKLPILAISAETDGNFAIDPGIAQMMLAGVAKVVTYDREAKEVLEDTLNPSVHCYNGAVRILWPGCGYYRNGPGPHIFRMASEVRREGSGLLLHLQQECIGNAQESDFGRLFSEAKVEVVSEQLKQLEANEAPPSTREERKADLTIKRLQRERDKLNGTVATIRVERDRFKEESDRRSEEVAQLLRELEAPDNLDEELKNLRNQNKHNKAEKREWEKTKTKLNDDNQHLRQKIQTLEKKRSANAGVVGRKGNSKVRAILLDDPELDNVTILTHAMTIFRDPMRTFIVGRLEQRNLRQIKKDLIYRDGLEEGDPKTFEKALDISGGESGYRQGYGGTLQTLRFEDVIAKFQERFPNSGIFAANLREIRRARNTVAHPPPGGLSPSMTVHGVRVIAETLDFIRESGVAVNVRSLADLILVAK